MKIDVVITKVLARGGEPLVRFLTPDPGPGPDL
jgi:hypothetical protein